MTTPTEIDSHESIETKIGKIVESLKKDDTGKLIMPDGLTPEMQAAVRSEKRRRDTNAAYTKGQTELRNTQAQLEVLKSQVKPKIILTPEQQQELDTIAQEQGAEAYRLRMNALEIEARAEQDKQLASLTEEAKAKSELERRKEVIQSFLKANPGLNLDDNTIKNEVPPRYIKELETGNWSFERFLEETKTFLTSEKAIGDGQKTLDQPNLSRTSGSDVPGSHKSTAGNNVSWQEVNF